MAVRIMARAAAHGCLLEALRTLQRLHHEGCLPEPDIFVKPFAGELSKWLALHVAKETALDKVVQFPRLTGLSDGGLHVALGANCDEPSIVDRMEVHWRKLRRFRLILVHGRFQH